MPKKFAGENSKSAEAKARKSEAKNSAAEKKAKETEDALWEETDKLVLRKQAKAAEDAKKAQEKLDKKREAEKLLEEEMKHLKSAKPSVSKVTRHDIQKNVEKEAAAKKLAEEKAKADALPAIVENLNRLDVDTESAKDIDEAILILSKSVDDGVDKHPEKRMKAAFMEWTDQNMERVRSEKPGLKLSQYKQMLFKEWQKSPSNPLNKARLEAE